MYVETEGVILKQNKILEDRRMLVLFTKKFGKISAGSTGGGRSRTKSSLALKPFTLGKYELYKGRNIYNVQSTDVIKSYYKIGEDIEKYINASFVLELTEKLLPEGETAPEIYKLLSEFLEIMEKREKEYGTIVCAYQLKALQYSGSMPHVSNCLGCGKVSGDGFVFDIAEGGIKCGDCQIQMQKNQKNTDINLIYKINPAIINVVNYVMVNPLHVLSKIKIEEKHLHIINDIIKRYLKFHFEIENLKSEGFM